MGMLSQKGPYQIPQQEKQLVYFCPKTQRNYTIMKLEMDREAELDNELGASGKKWQSSTALENHLQDAES